jgi:UDP-galactopyranose mutase
MNTFSKLWGVKTPAEAKAVIERQRKESGIKVPGNLEEQALFFAGRDIYEKLIKGYTEKQWGRPCNELPTFIIKRLPFRFTFDNNYFNDRWQGIPVGGYTFMVEKMLADVEISLNTEYSDFIRGNPNIAVKTVYTGAIDEFFGYSCGELEYRSLRFETETLDCDNWQGNAVVNYTERDIPFTRIIEHKHFEFGNQPKTVITREYSVEWQHGDEPYYPVNDERNTTLYQRYAALADERDDIIFGGRLGQYKYYDMDKVIAAALEIVNQEIAK